MHNFYMCLSDSMHANGTCQLSVFSCNSKFTLTVFLLDSFSLPNSDHRRHAHSYIEAMSERKRESGERKIYKVKMKRNRMVSIIVILCNVFR